jgi:hypothetical protein
MGGSDRVSTGVRFQDPGPWRAMRDALWTIWLVRLDEALQLNDAVPEMRCGICRRTALYLRVDDQRKTNDRIPSVPNVRTNVRSTGGSVPHRTTVSSSGTYPFLRASATNRCRQARCFRERDTPMPRRFAFVEGRQVGISFSFAKGE